ncbi:MAG: PaaI family thioesterase, partial [Bdellovibrionales bacterium]|nr:PaaI family thioesterase [Bdellovibrionales bacterium]
SNDSPFREYEAIRLPFHIGTLRAGYSERDQLSGLFLKLYQHKRDQSIRGHVAFGELLEGPPGHAHGGTIAYVLDEAMGTACWCAGHRCVAKTLKIDLLGMVPLEVDHEVWAGIMKADSENVWAWAEVRNSNGKVCTRSEGEFHILNEAQMKRLLKIE